MPNMDPKKCPMPSQEPNVRNKNFKEVALGYTEEMAVNEAKRCLQCKNHPCRSGCPVEIDIPGFIKHVAEGDFEAAYNVIAQSSALPAVCGRVCPQEHQCEGKCVRGIKGEAVGIGRLERFVADWYRNNVHTKPTAPAPNGHKVAVIGAGPSGLTVAGDLAKLGYKVTVYEALHVAGGVLMYGIPEFRLPKDIVQHEVEGLKELGVDIETNMVIGRVVSIDELISQYGFEAVFIGSGAGLPMFMHIPGENLCGVYSANEFLTRINLMRAYTFPEHDTPVKVGQRVAVIGGGNVAMDVCRSAVRLGARKVSCVYRRRREDMTALPEEVEGAVAEGVELVTLQAPVRIETNGQDHAVALWTQPQIIGEMDDKGRPKPEKAKLFEKRIAADGIVVAIGQGVETHGFEQSKITIKRGAFVAEASGQIDNMDGVFAGGDCVTGPATVIRAIAAGKVAAANIDEYLGYHHVIDVGVEVPTARLNNKPPHGRINTTEREADERKRDFKCIECGLTDEEAYAEASRCLRCDHFGYGIFRGGRKGKW